MEYEDFLSEIYSPIYSIKVLSDIIYTKINEEWNFCDKNTPKKDLEELLSRNLLTAMCAEYLLNLIKQSLDNLPITE